MEGWDADLFQIALDAVCDRPWDARVVEQLLAYPLDREAWDGLGSDVDEALSDLAQTLGRALLAFNRPAQATRWYERALPSLERAAEDADERTEQGAGSLIRLWEVLFQRGQIGTVRRGADSDDDEEARLARELACLARAAVLAERLGAVDPIWLNHYGVTCTSLVHLLLGAKRNDEALLWCDRAARAFEASRAQGCARSSRDVSGELLVADYFGLLGRDAEALVARARRRGSCRRRASISRRSRRRSPISTGRRSSLRRRST